MSVLTVNQYVDTATEFVNNIANSQNAYYLFYGKPDSWIGSTGAPDDTAVPVANSSVYAYEQSIYKDLAFGKLIQPSDVQYLIPRYNWVSNTVYQPYDQNDSSLYDKQFYVVNDTFEVYKCIDNNQGSPSTIRPSLTTTSGVFSTADGYVWKYMFTVDVTSNTKFTTTDYIPVTPNTEVTNNAVGGSIDFIKVIQGGNNYQAYDSGYLQSVVSSTVVRIANTAAPFSGRYINSSIYLKSGFGAGQLRQIRNYDGLNRLVTVSTPFNVYTVFNVANVQGSVYNGLLLTQRVDALAFLYAKGYYNIGDQLVQTDTQAAGSIITANTSTFKIDKTSANDFSLGLPVYNSTQSASLKSGKVNYLVNRVQGTQITFAGSGYRTAPSVTVTANAGDVTGTGASITAHANSSGRIDYLTITANGSNYTLPPVINIAAPSAISFSGNTTSVNVTSDAITLGTNTAYFANGDQVKYLVGAGNTAIGGLTNNTIYYVTNTTSTTIQLAANSTGSPINITSAASSAQAGHSFTGEQATAIAPLNIFIASNSGSTAFTTDFPVGSYVRVGDNANVNIRYVTAVNSSVITIASALANTANVSGANVYAQPYAASITSVSTLISNGVISNTNLNSVTLQITNAAILSLNFIVGERIDMVGSDNITQGANGIVAYANSSTVILSNISGTFLTGSNNFLRGYSSLQKTNISSVANYPTITIVSPVGGFTSGQTVYFRTLPDLTAIGNAMVLSTATVPNELTEYTISPSVTITGDGSGAVAYSVVNTTFGSSNNITNIVVLNTGSNYTFANIAISSNALFGGDAYGNPTATARAILSPITGHGSNAYKELGARYVGVTTIMDSGINESFRFRVNGKFRRIGVIKNPLFNEIVVNLNSFDRNKFTLENSGTFDSGEYVIQAGSNAVGQITYSNLSFMEVKGVQGTFIANGSGDEIYGLTSGSSANVKIANVSYFQELSALEIVQEDLPGFYNSGKVSATISQVISNTQLRLTNVSGRFDSNAILYDTTTNSYANVTSIYIANGTTDGTSTFGLRFSQLCRIPLTSNTGAYVVGETVTQQFTNATGVVISTNTDHDFVITNANGSFNAGDHVYTNTASGNALVIFANSTYIRTTSANGDFESLTSQRLINNLNIGADISSISKVLVLKDVSSSASFQTGSYIITGNTSAAVGRALQSNTISYPELVKNSGSVIYLENIAPLTRANTTKEQVSLVIKF